MSESVRSRTAIGSLFRTAASVARKLPAGELPALVIEGYGQAVLFAHDATVQFLVDRKILPDGHPRQLPDTATAPHPDTAPEVLETLISRSLRQDTAAGKKEFHHAVLKQLVADEARILVALAEGAPAPLVHVHHRSRGDVVLENASLIGRTASVTVPSLTPRYVSRLRSLGLLEVGPEDAANGYGYELLLADSAVRQALRVGQFGKVPAKVVKRTVGLSPLGREVWAATQVGEPVAARRAEGAEA